MSFHNKDQIILPNRDNLYGSVYKPMLIRDEHNEVIYRQRFSLSKVQWWAMDTDNARCSSEVHHPDIMSCVTAHVESVTRCRGPMPKSNMSLPVCSSSEIIRKFREMSFMLQV